MACGAGRLITQSISFLYALRGPLIKTEDEPVDRSGYHDAVLGHEEKALSDERFETVVLRYGLLYGPGTWYAMDGHLADGKVGVHDSDRRQRRPPQRSCSDEARDAGGHEAERLTYKRCVERENVAGPREERRERQREESLCEEVDRQGAPAPEPAHMPVKRKNRSHQSR